MAKHHIPDVHSSHPNVTPLIDIIMCLIIFFMLVAKIGVTTGAEKIDIPTTVLGSKIEDMSNTLTLNIPGNINADYPQVEALIKPAGGGAGAMTSLPIQDSVTGQNVLQNTLQLYKKQNPNFKVIIRANQNLDWRFIEPVLLTCQSAGVVSINFNTSQAKGG
jgi:biopolymer transport protein ExbD